jgi:hypothetical protein
MKEGRKEGRGREREREGWINAGRLHLWRCGGGGREAISILIIALH